MNNLIHPHPSIEELQKQFVAIQIHIKDIYILDKQFNISNRQDGILLKQTKSILKKVIALSNELESRCTKLLSDIYSALSPFKLSIQFREIGVPIIEIVNNALLADNKHTIKKMTIMVANRINAPFIDIMCDYGNGFKSTIVHNQTYFDSLDKVSEHGLLVIKICPTDFGLEKSVDVTLIIY